jgi:ribonuclease P protein component
VVEKFYQEEEQKEEKSSLLKFPKEERISNWSQIRYILSQMEPIKFDTVDIYSLPQKEWGLAIVLKKTVKGACNRNKIKRIIREAYRTTKPAYEKPRVFVFVVSSIPESISYNELKNFMIKHFANKESEKKNK